MRPNIGLINALVRITAGFTILAWATAKLVRRPYRNTPLVAAFLGAMKVAEGITRYCPLTDLFEDRIYQMKEQQISQTNQDKMESINPS